MSDEKQVPNHLGLLELVDYWKGLAEALHKENAALREIAAIFVDSALRYRADLPDSLNAWYECPFCQRTDSRLMASEFDHAPGCPVTKARALLGSNHAE